MGDPADVAVLNANSGSVVSVTFGRHPDVVLVFPECNGAQLKVEKRKLMQSSEVFQALFSADFENDSGRIEITDISFETFRCIMKYLCKNQIDITQDNFQEMLYVAAKYFIYRLIGKVTLFIQQFIKCDNLHVYYEFLERYEMKKINDHIQEICERSPIVVINQLSGDSEVHMRILTIILKSPILTCKEFDLYLAIVKMLKKARADEHHDRAPEMRKKLGKLLYLIRFPTMTINELILCGKAPSILTEKQIVDLLLWKQAAIYSTVVHQFSTRPRMYPSTK